MNELRDKIKELENLILSGRFGTKNRAELLLRISELTSLVDKPQVSLNETNNTLEGKSITEGHKGSEVTQTPNLDEIDKVYAGIYGLFNTGVNLDSMDYEYETETLEPCVKALINSLVAEHDDKIREEAVERVFNWLSEANYDCTVQELYEKYLKGLSGDTK